MSSDNWKVPSRSERALELVASDFYVAQAEDGQSPIDDFYSYLRSIITIGTREALELHPSLGKVLLLGIVSGTEYYFRAMLSKLIRACPLTRAHSAPQMLTFGATEYYSPSEIGFALLEGHSFSSKLELVKQTERVTAFKWKESSSISSAVAEFDRLCHLRHAAVHARGDIGARNIQGSSVQVFGLAAVHVLAWVDVLSVVEWAFSINWNSQPADFRRRCAPVRPDVCGGGTG